MSRVKGPLSTNPKDPGAAGRGAPGRRRVPRAVQEQRMLDVAFERFGTLGYDNVSMDAVAADVGVTKPMLYSYFGSKAGLFAACADRAAHRLRESVGQAGADPLLPPDQRLWLGLLAVFAAVQRHPEAWRVLYPAGRGSGPMSVRAARARDEMTELLAGLFTAAYAEATPGREGGEHAIPLAHAMTGATIAIAQWSLEHPEEPVELQTLRLMNFAWLGFGDLLAGHRWLPPAGSP